MSDVFGSLVRQYVLGQKADEAEHWLIGCLGCIPAGGLPRATRRCVRSSAPGNRPTRYRNNEARQGLQPTMLERRPRSGSTKDNGGVHTNGHHPELRSRRPPTSACGNAWELAGRVWYETLRDPHLRPTAQFRDVRPAHAGRRCSGWATPTGPRSTRRCRMPGVRWASPSEHRDHGTPRAGRPDQRLFEVSAAAGFAGIVTRRRAPTLLLSSPRTTPRSRGPRGRRRPGRARAEPGRVGAGSDAGHRWGRPVPVPTSRWTTASTCTASPCRTAPRRHSCSRS